jgi:hypothetical protein
MWNSPAFAASALLGCSSGELLMVPSPILVRGYHKNEE